MTPFFDDLERQLRAAAAQHGAARAPWWRRPRNLALLAVAALGLGTPAVARVSGVWDPGVEHVAPTPPTVTVSASHATTCKDPPASGQPPGRGDARLDPELVAHIAVLRRPQRATDTYPTPPPGGGFPGVDPASTRYVGSVAGRRYFALAARSRVRVRGCGEQPATRRLELCLLGERGGGGCGIPARDFLKQGISGSSGGSAGKSVVTGLVPDEVAEVTYRYGASERSFTVSDNFYGFEIAVDVMQAPDAVIWTLRDGTSRTIR